MMQYDHRALDDFLREKYPKMLDTPQTVYACMKNLAVSLPREFLEDENDPNSIVRFTELRKLALAVVAKQCGYNAEEVRV